MKRLLIVFFIFLLVFPVIGQSTFDKLNGEGIHLYNEGKHAEAILVFEKAKIQAEKEFGKNTEIYATSCNNLALLYKNQGKYSQTEPLYIEAKNIYEKVLGKEHPNYALSCNNLAGLYRSQGKYTQAELLYIEAKNIREKILGKEHPDYASTCNNLALLYVNQSKYDQAAPLYIEAKNIYEKTLGKNHTDYALSCNNLASLYVNQSKYDQAELLYIEAKIIREKVLGKEHPYYAESCNNLASLYRRQGKYAKAESLYIEAKNICEKTLSKEHINYAVACNNLAFLYYDQGKYAQAEPLYTEAKNIREKVLGREHLAYAESCNSLALLYYSQGKYLQAEPLVIETKNIREKILSKEHPYYAESCNNLAALYKKRGKYVQAEELYIEAKNIYEKTLSKNHPDYAESCNNLASMYKEQDKHTQAELLFIEAKNISEKILGKEHPNYAKYCNNLAVLYEKKGRYVQAEILHLETKKILEKLLGKEHPYYASSANNLAFLYQIQGRYAQAEPLYTEANQTLIAQIERNFSALSEKEKGQYYATFVHNLEAFISFTIKYYPQKPAISGEVFNNTLATKGLFFDAGNKIRKRIIQSNDEPLKLLYQDWKNKKEYLSKIYQIGKVDRLKQEINVDALENEVNEIEKKLSQKSEQFAKANDKTRYTWQDVQKKLKPGETAIELIRFQVFNKKWTDSVKYMALIIKPESQYPEMVILENGKELEGKYAKYYINAIKNKKQDKNSYNQYWAKIQAKLSGIKKVYLSVDGIYNSLNINTLYNPETQKYLGEVLEVQLLSNTKDLITAKASDTPIKNATLIGFPDYNSSPKSNATKDDSLILPQIKNDTTQRFFNGDNITELLGTKMEVNNLESILQKSGIKTQKYLETQASEELVKKLNSPQVLHIATHGFFLQDIEENTEDDRGLMGMESKKIIENPLLRSGLLFANARNALKGGGDGVLTAYEAMNLNLDNTDLVVLSACETGLGEVKNGEGVYGLQRAFQQAGAKTVLMSLWTVSDEATQELMTLFYQNYITKKLPKRQAFQNAQNELKKKFPEPYYWGAFVMVGE